jgi:hypothetical protein
MLEDNNFWIVLGVFLGILVGFLFYREFFKRKFYEKLKNILSARPAVALTAILPTIPILIIFLIIKSDFSGIFTISWFIGTLMGLIICNFIYIAKKLRK